MDKGGKSNKSVKEEMIIKLEKCFAQIAHAQEELGKEPNNEERACDLDQREVFALCFKQEGNVYFKGKNYIDAMQAYTKAIDMMCGNIDIDSTLYNNRSAANYFLKNYRSSLDDCEFALALKPDYKKCTIRAANCYYQLKQIQKCLIYCEKILDLEPDHKEIVELRQKCMEANSVVKNKVKIEKSQDDLVLEEISKRNIKICTNGPFCIENIITEYNEHRVYLDDAKNLIWPVCFLHHSLKSRLLIPNFREGQTIGTYIFSNIPQWMVESFYKLKNLNVYCCNGPFGNVFKVDVQSTLLNILQKEKFVLMGGIPVFHIVLKNSLAEVSFFPHSKS